MINMILLLKNNYLSLLKFNIIIIIIIIITIIITMYKLFTDEAYRFILNINSTLVIRYELLLSIYVVISKNAFG
jgi:hypothetical protein